VELRDMMIQNNVLVNLRKICKMKYDKNYNLKKFGCDNNENAKSQFISLLKNVSWSVSNFCRYGGHKKEDLRILLECLYHLLSNEMAINADNESLNGMDTEPFSGNIGWSFCYLLDKIDESDNVEILDIMNKSGITRLLIELLGSNNVYTIHAVLRAVGNILTGNDKYTAKCIQFGILPYLQKLLKQFHSKDDQKLKEICWAISNITAGTGPQIMAVIECKEIFPILVDILSNSRNVVAREALWAISNATASTNHSVLTYLCNIGVVKALCNFFQRRFAANQSFNHRDKTLLVGLECIENMLLYGINQTFIVEFEENGGLDFLEYLQSDDKISQEVYDKSVDIIKRINNEQNDEQDNNHNHHDNNINQDINNQFGFGLNSNNQQTDSNQFRF